MLRPRQLEILRPRQLEIVIIQSKIIQQVTVAVSIPNLWEQSISWLLRTSICELLQPSVPQQGKSIDVSFISTSCSVRES